MTERAWSFKGSQTEQALKQAGRVRSMSGHSMVTHSVCWEARGAAEGQGHSRQTSVPVPSHPASAAQATGLVLAQRCGLCTGALALHSPDPAWLHLKFFMASRWLLVQAKAQSILRPENHDSDFVQSS